MGTETDRRAGRQAVASPPASMRNRRRLTSSAAVLAVGLATAAAGAGLVGRAGAGTAPTTTATVTTTVTVTMAEAAAPADVGLNTLLDAPTRYDDRQVRTTGGVHHVAPFLLTLSPVDSGSGSTPTGTPTTGGGERLVVAYGDVEVPPQGTRLTVTGTVQDAFDVEAIERALRISLNRNMIETLGLGQDDVVLIADSWEAADQSPTWTATP